MCRRIFSVVVILTLCLAGIAQDKASYKFFVPDNNFTSFGLYSSLGTVISSGQTAESAFVRSVTSTTDYQVNMKADGKVGLSAGFGGFLVAKRSFVRFVDFGVSYEQFRGSETLEAHRTFGSDLSFPDDLDYTGKFNYHLLSFSFNAQSAVMLGARSMFHFGPGIEIDQSLALKSEYEPEIISINTELPPKLNTTKFAYSAGLTFKISDGGYLDFYVKKAFISLENESAFDTSTQIYNSEFNYLKAGVKLLWMNRPADRVCPANSRGRNGSRLGKKKLRSDFYPW